MREGENGKDFFVPGILNPALLVTGKTKKEVLERGNWQKWSVSES